MNNFPALISQAKAISDYGCQAAFGDEELRELRDLSLALNEAAARIEHKIFQQALLSRQHRRTMKGRI